ncbi:SpoIIE family protein phosphatase [Streptomyces clavifer]|uniref:ATP-binding SpoIIE family protein phosphatase n=2 Tax=Streptomyces TaxID=1883 RepID=UPI0033BCEAF7
MADGPLMAVDGDGMVTRWSAAAEWRFGLTADAAVGQQVMAVLAAGEHLDRGTAGLRLLPSADPGAHWGVWSESDGPREGERVLGPAVLDVLFAKARVRVHVLDRDLRVVRVTDPSGGAALSERLRGRPFAEVYGFDDPEAVDASVREVLRTGGTGGERMFRARPSGGAPGRRTLSLSAFRLEPEWADGIPGVVVSVTDATERVGARAREAALSAVRGVVGGTLDVETTCRDLVDAVVPGYADVAVVEVVDSVLRGEDLPTGPPVPGVPLRRAAFGARSADPAHPVGDVRAVLPATPFQRVLSDPRPRLVPLVDVPWADADPARAAAIRTSGAHTLVVAPLTVRGAVLGLVSLYRCEDSDPYTEDDLPVVEDMASRTALSIDNARRYVHERAIASTLQHRLFPRGPTSHGAVETAHLVLPGAGSGCWFDTIALPGARTALVIGEVAGQGIHVAITMGQLRTVIHALAELDLEPDELLARLYDTASRLVQERAELPPSDPLRRSMPAATCVYAVYDPFSRTCTVASAGHPAPLVVGPDGAASVAGLAEGPPLGSQERAPSVAASTFPLREGSLLAFCSSALQAHAESSMGALRRVLTEAEHSPGHHPRHRPDGRPGRSLPELCDEVAYALPATVDLQGAALLLARTGSIPADRFGIWNLPHDSSAPAAARGLATRQLADWNLDGDTGYATELIVSELVTNAVHYGLPPLELRLVLDRVLMCEVRDASSVSPNLRYARTIDEGGRGLFIVSQLATQWGTRYAPGGKTVWTEQSLPPEQTSG